MKRALLTTAALAAAVAVYTAFSLPPRRLTLSPAFDDGTVPGVLHVHTNRSDGRSSPETVAAIAARLGLRFIVFTDHGDATRKPDAPAYLSGVLCLDGVEISTNGGHYIAVGMPESPYPLGGEARDVVEDVRRLGGFGIAAHPDSPKAELRWREWAAPIDAIELLNPDTSWRVHAVRPGIRPKVGLVRALLTYPLRPAESIAGLLVNASSAIDEFERIATERRIVAVAGADAHAKLELRNVDPGDNRFSLELPGYQAALQVMSVRIRPAAPLTDSDAAADAERLLRGLRSGHLYTAIDAWASPPAFSFSASNVTSAAGQGDEVTMAGPAQLHVRSNAPAGFITTVWQGRSHLVDSDKNDVAVQVTGPGVFRVEIRRGTATDAPAWIISNPIFLRGQPRGMPATGPSPGQSRVAGAGDKSGAARPLFDGRTLTGWNTETDPSSLVALELAPRVDGTEIRLRYGLSGGSNVGQFSGATVEAPHDAAAFDRIAFTARAEHPMRISVQARARVEGGEARWQRSVYLDSQDRDVTVAFDDMTPLGATPRPPLPREGLLNVMFIVDTTNTTPGASGRVWIRSPRLER